MADDLEGAIDAFVQAIHDRRKVRITYRAEKYGGEISRVCAPMDYGPFRGAALRNGNYFHTWDYEGSSGPHQAAIPASNFRRLEVLEQGFDPSEFVSDSWDPWWTPRDWGPPL